METVRWPAESLAQGVRQNRHVVALAAHAGQDLMGELSLRNLSGPVTIADLAGNRCAWAGLPT